MEFCPGTNLLFGQNGQGKTNLLEAIYMLGYGRSFRTGTPRDCIRHGARGLRVHGEVEHQGLCRDLGIVVPDDEDKKLTIFHKPVGLAEFVGNLHVLAFTQEHLKVVRGGPAERRAFLDRALITANPGHIQRIAAYSRALKQRNRILGSALSSGVRADRTLLEAWEEKLAREGSQILCNRRRYIEEMKKEIGDPLCSRESIGIRYEASGVKTGADAAALESEFRENLQELRRNDERRGFTTIGPHRDDLKIELDGKPLADFGSAGQQRSALLALYFAQMEIHFKKRGFYPLFLMDDVEAELDNERLLAFLAHLEQRTQTFLTTAKEQVLPTLPRDSRRYRVREGTVVQV